MWALMITAAGLPVLFLLVFTWLMRLLVQTEVPSDVLGAGNRLGRLSWLGRLRAWLTSTRKLDYRRDGEGRFRRVRRG